jgi:adenylyl- and sulfurtransferase ThiI
MPILQPLLCKNVDEIASTARSIGVFDKINREQKGVLIL